MQSNKTKIINILSYTNNRNNTKDLQRGTLSFETIDEAFDYFENIRRKTKSVEIWSYPYIREYKEIVEFVNINGAICVKQIQLKTNP